MIGFAASCLESSLSRVAILASIFFWLSLFSSVDTETFVGLSIRDSSILGPLLARSELNGLKFELKGLGGIVSVGFYTVVLFV